MKGFWKFTVNLEEHRNSLQRLAKKDIRVGRLYKQGWHGHSIDMYVRHYKNIIILHVGTLYTFSFLISPHHRLESTSTCIRNHAVLQKLKFLLSLSQHSWPQHITMVYTYACTSTPFCSTQVHDVHVCLSFRQVSLRPLSILSMVHAHRLNQGAILNLVWCNMCRPSRSTLFYLAHTRNIQDGKDREMCALIARFTALLFREVRLQTADFRSTIDDKRYTKKVAQARVLWSLRQQGYNKREC